MYLYIGKDTVLRAPDIVGIFDLENTSVSRLTKGFLAKAQKADRVVTVSAELPKSFVLCAGKKDGHTLYLSQISPATLKKRAGEKIK